MGEPRIRSEPSGPPAAQLSGGAGAGRRPSRSAARVSDDLRRHSDPFLDRRRRIAGLSLAAVGAMAVVSGYQVGVLRHLPEPPLARLDADRVDAAPEAYQLLRTPDATLGIVSYGITAALAAAGSRRRAEDVPWLVVALAAKVVADAVGGLVLTVEQATRHRRFCSWCLAASAASVAMVPAVVPETRAALRSLRRPG